MIGPATSGNTGDTQEDLAGLTLPDVAPELPPSATPDPGALADLIAQLPVAYPRSPTGNLGAPSLWDREKAARVLGALSSGATLAKTLAAEGISNHAWQCWLDRVPQLQPMYHLARRLQAHAIFDEMLQTARDNAENPKNEVKNSAVRMLLDSLRWAAAKLNPRDYGEKLQVSGAVAITITTNLDLDDAAVEANKPPALDMEETDGIYTVKAPLKVAMTGPAVDNGNGTEATGALGAPSPHRPRKPTRPRNPDGSRIDGRQKLTMDEARAEVLKAEREAADGA